MLLLRSLVVQTAMVPPKTQDRAQISATTPGGPNLEVLYNTPAAAQGKQRENDALLDNFTCKVFQFRDLMEVKRSSISEN
jgi:hypothetical protein